MEGSFRKRKVLHARLAELAYKECRQEGLGDSEGIPARGRATGSRLVIATFHENAYEREGDLAGSAYILL
jgi:hypothetical protein